MSTHEFPRYGGGQELTAPQVNALIDQMRRQARLYATAPLEAIQTPTGWLVRWSGPQGFWAVLGAPEDGCYPYEEVWPDQTGAWSAVPGGRRAPAASGAAEINGRPDATAGTVVFMTPSEGGLTGVTASFAAPPSETTLRPGYFWAEITAVTGGRYSFTRLEYTDGGFDRATAPIEYAGAYERAVEANGRTDVSVGQIVLMRIEPGGDRVPAFSASVAAAGFWARSGVKPGLYELELTRDRFRSVLPDGFFPSPEGGTWTFSVSDRFGGALGTSGPIAFDATAAEVQAAVDAMTEFNYGSLSVTGDDGGPWFFTFMGDLAFQGQLSIDTAGLDYGDAPPLGGGGGVSGPYSGYTYFSSEPGDDGYWVEVERSAAGSWYTARDPQYAFSPQPSDPDVPATAVAANRVAFVEPHEVPDEDANVRLEVSAEDFDMTDTQTGAALSASTQSAVLCLSDGRAAFVLVVGATGNFKLRHARGVSSLLSHAATAAEVEAAINTTTDSDFYRVAVSGVSVATGVSVRWEDLESHVESTTAAYYYGRQNAEATHWGNVSIGHSRVNPVGSAFSEIWEIRTYHPAEDAPKPTGGTFTLSYGAAPEAGGDEDEGDEEAETFVLTDPIAFDATFQDIQDQLEPIVGRGNLYCEGGPLPFPVRVYFTGDLGGTETPGLFVAENALETAAPDGGTGDDAPAADVSVFRPHARTLVTAGPQNRTGLATVKSATVTCGGQSATFIPFSTTGAGLATAVGTAVTAIGTRRIAGEGTAGGPWRLVFKDTLAREGPEEFTYSVQSGAAFTLSGEAGTADGTTSPPTGGAVKLCVGAQWKVELSSGPGSKFTVTANGQSVSPPVELGYGSSAAQVAAAFSVPSIIGAQENGQGVAGAVSLTGDGGPLGIAPVYLELHGFPCHLRADLAVATTSFVTPAQPTVRMTATHRDEFTDDAVYIEIASSSPGAVGGTWTMSNLSDYGTVFPNPPLPSVGQPLPWNATALDVQAAVRGFQYRVGGAYLNVPTVAATPYSEATCTGGPLPDEPVLIRIPTGRSAVWRKYVGGGSGSGVNATPPWPHSAMFTPTTTGLVRPPQTSVGPTAVSVTWLGTEEMDPGEMTAETVEAALRATPAGALVRCAEADDGTGGIVLSIPDYAGPPQTGNLGKRFSAFGYVEGGHLKFFYNSAPQDYSGPDGGRGEANLAWPGAAGDLGASNLGQRTDSQLAQIATQPFRAFITRFAGTPSALDPSANGYPWVELTPGAGRTPRSFDQAYFAYRAPNDYTTATEATLATPSQLAVEAGGNLNVPYGTEVWIEPSAGYYFSRRADRPVPRLARVTGRYGVPAYLGGTAGDTYNEFTQTYTDYAERLLFEADPADLRVNAGRAAKQPIEEYVVLATTGRYIGAFPNRLGGVIDSVPPGFGSGVSSEPSWIVPEPYGSLTSTPAGSALTYPITLLPSFHASGQGPAAFGQVPARSGVNNFIQTLGTGDKGVTGTTFLFAPDNTAAAGIGGEWGRIDSALLPDYLSPGLLLSGRSLAVEVTPTAVSSTVTFGSWGAIGPFYRSSSVAYVQGLCDALFGEGNSTVVKLFNDFDGNINGWRFYFAGGTFGRRDPGVVSGAGCTITTLTAPLDPSASGTWNSIVGSPGGEIGGTVSHRGAGGIKYSDGFLTQDPGQPTGAFYYTLREATFNAGLNGTVGALWGAGTPACTLQVATGSGAGVAASGSPGSRLMLDGTIPMECAAGRGVQSALVLNWNAYGTYGGVGGNYMEFHGGLCTHCEYVDPGGVTGSFPTADGRTATVVQGFIMSVA